MTQPSSHILASCHHKHSGFTLIELVLVLVLIGILGAVVAPRLMLNNQFEQRLQADRLVGLLRQAQLRAMNDPQAVTENPDISRCAKVVITKQGFSIAAECKTQLLDSDTLIQQGQQGYFVGARDINITANRTLPFILQFGQTAAEDEDKEFLTEASLLGRPFIGTEQLPTTLNITIGGKTVNIEPEGYIHGP